MYVCVGGECPVDLFLFCFLLFRPLNEIFFFLRSISECRVHGVGQ